MKASCYSSMMNIYPSLLKYNRFPGFVKTIFQKSGIFVIFRLLHQ